MPSLNWFPIILFFIMTMLLVLFMTKIMIEEKKQAKLTNKKN
jgi:uncharacterized membrane protein